VAFKEIAESITERVDDPAAAGVDRYVGLEHLDPDSTYIRRWGSPDDVGSTKLRFHPGDVVYGRRRAYQRKLGVADFEGICSAHALVLRARPDTCLAEFLPYFLQSDAFHERALSISVGSLSPTINWKTLAVQKFSLPPLDEQKPMVEVLDEAHTVVELWRSAADAVTQLRLAQAHWVAEQGAGRGALTRVVDLVAHDRPVTYGILKPGTGHPGGVPVVKVRDYPNGYIEEDDLLLTSPEIDSEYKRSRLRPGDLLISIRGTVGRVAEVPPTLDAANITQDTARLSIAATHDRTYIRHMLESRFVQRQIEQRITGLAVKGLNIGELRKIEIPTPPIEDQRRIAGEFEVIAKTQRRLFSHIQASVAAASAIRERCLRGCGQ